MPRTDIFDASGLVESIADPRPLEAQKAERMADLADIRWQRTQSFTFDGVVTAADRAIPALTGAVVGLQAVGGAGTVTWKLAAGEFRVFDIAALVAFGQAMRGHIQACFDREAEISAEIMAAETAEALDSIGLAEGWPE